VGLAGSVLLWEEAGSLHARVSTNATEALLRRKLRLLNAEQFVEHITRFEDLLRMNGGTYVLIRWREGVDRERVKSVLSRL
jgi:hypothetical protein